MVDFSSMRIELPPTQLCHKQIKKLLKESTLTQNKKIQILRAQNHRTIVISSMKKKKKKKLLKANCTLNGYYKIWQISPEGKVCETSRLKPSPRSRPGVKQKLTYTRISKRSKATVCSKINVQA